MRKLITNLVTLLLILSSCSTINENQKVATFEGAREWDLFKAENVQNYQDFIPEVVFSDNPDFVVLYNEAWDIAHTKVKNQPGLPQSPYIDEGLWDDTIWIWDTAFMTLFCKYAPEAFPGVESLRNFYETLHAKDPVRQPLVTWHPDNPPLFSWVEYDNYQMSGNKAHLEELLESGYLQTHFNWFDTVPRNWRSKMGPRVSAPTRVKKYKNGYTWNGISSGMDNTPRGAGVGYSNTLWIDAISQQALSALYIARLCEEVGKADEAKIWHAKYDELATIVNTHYWDESDGFYYDINRKNNEAVKVMTPASFWPVLAEMASDEQVAQMVRELTNPETLGGAVPTPTVARNDRAFVPEGQYWRGGVWLPTTYMTFKAINKYGYLDLSRKLSLQLLHHMSETYKQFEPASIWECYSPTEYKPATYATGIRYVREDFCGWSALGPISLFIEDIIGIYDINAIKKEVSYNPYPTGESGIKNLRFGNVQTDIIKKGNQLSVKSSGDYTLKIRIADDKYRNVEVKAGETVVTL